jgi:hypothetical protein
MADIFVRYLLRLSGRKNIHLIDFMFVTVCVFTVPQANS